MYKNGHHESKGNPMIEEEVPEQIVMTLELHLTLQIGIMQSIRKHTIKGLMGYTPMVFRLGPAFTEHNTQGYWETMGYGLLALTKYNWDPIGGQNVEEFTNKWGGEDWETVDRSAGLDLADLPATMSRTRVDGVNAGIKPQLNIALLLCLRLSWSPCPSPSLLCPRLQANGIETFKYRYPGLVHYYHSHKGMWNS